MTTHDIIRAAIPNADDETCSFILWERTPYPFMRITAKTLYAAARRFQRAVNGGLRLCDFCDRMAENNKSVCAKCHKALST